MSTFDKAVTGEADPGVGESHAPEPMQVRISFNPHALERWVRGERDSP